MNNPPTLATFGNTTRYTMNIYIHVHILLRNYPFTTETPIGCYKRVRTIAPTARYSDRPLFRRPIIPTAHYSDGPFFRQYKIELNPQIHGLTSKNISEKWLEESKPSVTYIFQYMNVLYCIDGKQIFKMVTRQQWR